MHTIAYHSEPLSTEPFSKTRFLFLIQCRMVDQQRRQRCSLIFLNLFKAHSVTALNLKSLRSLRASAATRSLDLNDLSFVDATYVPFNNYHVDTNSSFISMCLYTRLCKDFLPPQPTAPAWLSWSRHVYYYECDNSLPACHRPGPVLVRGGGNLVGE